MQITRYSDYSLRVLIYLAAKGDSQSTIREIADSYNISKNHLMKVVQELNSQNYVIALRGKNGGLRLNGRPEDINIGKLVRYTEQEPPLLECFSNDNHCIISSACKLKLIFREAKEAFFTLLDQYSLADLLPAHQQTTLIRLLNINP